MRGEGAIALRCDALPLAPTRVANPRGTGGARAIRRGGEIKCEAQRELQRKRQRTELVETYFFRPTPSASSTRSLLRWARSQLFVDAELVDMVAQVRKQRNRDEGIAVNAAQRAKSKRECKSSCVRYLRCALSWVALLFCFAMLRLDGTARVDDG